MTHTILPGLQWLAFTPVALFVVAASSVGILMTRLPTSLKNYTSTGRPERGMVRRMLTDPRAKTERILVFTAAGAMLGAVAFLEILLPLISTASPAP